jgi:8-oxo-dGTP diphosphatase
MSGNPRNPYPTVDVIIETGRGIVLIERRNAPHGWALPGGFIDYGEDPADGARREVMEETGLEVELTELFSVYGAPDRDPRQHNLSVVYLGRSDGEPSGSDDAARAAIFPLEALPAVLAFDHARILDDYRYFLASGERPAPAGALSAKQTATLLASARAAIDSALGGSAVAPDTRDPALVRLAGCFVTLRTADGSLRGCIGDLAQDRPLIESVKHCAVGAATRDTRFSPVTREEVASLHIGISVLTPVQALPRMEALVVGKHGLLVEQGPRRGVLLPEVASEQGWTREQFLSATCRKAGLPLDAWRDPSTRLSVFTTLKIEEPKTGGR